MTRCLPCNQGLKSSMNVPSFRVALLPWEEICMLNVYHPMGAVAGLEMEMVRVLSLWCTSCAFQPLPLDTLESGNTAFVLADSEGDGPGKEGRVNGNQGVPAGWWGEIRFQYNRRDPLRDVIQGSTL